MQALFEWDFAHRPDGEIKDILLREIEAADLHGLDVEEVGTVLEVKDGVARIYGLRKAMAGYYDRRFNVKLNPNTQVVVTLGSKEGFANMAQTITAPGDVVLVPKGYHPVGAAHGAVR